MSGVYSTGTRPFECTNVFRFTVTSAGATIPVNVIRLTLDGRDVTPCLQITGSDSTKSVVCPELPVNAIHTAIINVTNSLDHGITVTNQFDTFSQDNDLTWFGSRDWAPPPLAPDGGRDEKEYEEYEGAGPSRGDDEELLLDMHRCSVC